MADNKPKVISVAAVSGGGKTTVSTILGQRLGNSPVIYFDDRDYGVDPVQLSNNGYDHSMCNLDLLVNDIEVLQNKNDLKYIIMDFPFAYKNTQIAKYIDKAIYIDTPLDVALARRIIRDFANEPTEVIVDDMKNYLTFARQIYLYLPDVIMPNSDFIVDGTLTPEQITDEIIKYLQK